MDGMGAFGRVAGLLLLLLATAPGAVAQAVAPAPDKPAETKPGTAAEPKPGTPATTRPALPPDAASEHALHLAGRELAYRATAGTLELHDAAGKEQATVFYVAYTLKPGGAALQRPITFAFNGGPGAAAAYLQLGAVGPRIVDFADDRSIVPRSPGLIDNPATWLDFTDLVFVDPVGTGYSRAAPGVDAAKTYWGVRQDIAALREVVRLYLARAGRSAAPVWLLGESYGGFRAARLAHALMTEDGVPVAGTVMISPVLDFALIRRAPGDPLASALRLPSYAAVELERQGKLTPEALGEVEGFALGDYLTGLAAGLPDATRAQHFYAALAGFTGLPEPLVRRLAGHIPPAVFAKDFLAADGRILSRYDGSVSAPDPHPGSLVLRADDPILDGTRPVFTGRMLAYLHDELGFSTDRTYRLLDGAVSQHWDWETRGPAGDVSAVDDLKEALSVAPRFRALIAQGMTDLVTPYMASRYVLAHLPASERDRAALHLYAGGHMMYIRPATRRQLHEDAAALYRAAEK